MVRNDTKARGSGALGNRPHDLTLEEVRVFADNDLLMSVEWHLPVSWNISQGRLAIPPLPRGDEPQALIVERHVPAARGGRPELGGQQHALAGQVAGKVPQQYRTLSRRRAIQ
jgi:hypothetical protein